MRYCSDFDLNWKGKYFSFCWREFLEFLLLIKIAEILHHTKHNNNIFHYTPPLLCNVSTKNYNKKKKKKCFN